MTAPAGTPATNDAEGTPGTDDTPGAPETGDAEGTPGTEDAADAPFEAIVPPAVPMPVPETPGEPPGVLIENNDDGTVELGIVEPVAGNCAIPPAPPALVARRDERDEGAMGDSPAEDVIDEPAPLGAPEDAAPVSPRPP